MGVWLYKDIVRSESYSRFELGLPKSIMIAVPSSAIFASLLPTYFRFRDGGADQDGMPSSLRSFIPYTKSAVCVLKWARRGRYRTMDKHLTWWGLYGTGMSSHSGEMDFFFREGPPSISRVPSFCPWCIWIVSSALRKHGSEFYVKSKVHISDTCGFSISDHSSQPSQDHFLFILIHWVREVKLKRGEKINLNSPFHCFTLSH